MQTNVNSLFATTTNTVTNFMIQTYAWMSGGLLLTALVAFYINFQIETNANFVYFLVQNSWVLPAIFIVELLVVVVLSGMINRMSLLMASMLFLFFSLLNGVSIGLFVAAYTPASAFIAFGATAGTFILMSVYGAVTKADLTRFGHLAIMGLIGIILGTILNIFFRSEAFSWILTYVGIAIFIVLIAYDTQKLKRFAQMADDKGNIAKYAVMGALSLYLDFINLFIRLLSIFGKRR